MLEIKVKRVNVERSHFKTEFEVTEKTPQQLFDANIGKKPVLLWDPNNVVDVPDDKLVEFSGTNTNATSFT